MISIQQYLPYPKQTELQLQVILKRCHHIAHVSGLRIMRVFLFLKCLFLHQNPMFYHLLESSHRDDSNKWSNIGFGEEITKVESIEVHFTHLIWSSDVCIYKNIQL